MLLSAPRRSATLPPEVTRDLQLQGYHCLPDALDPLRATALLTDLKAAHPFDRQLFLSEAEFDADPVWRGVNPRPGRNLLDRFEAQLDLVEADPGVTDALVALLGADYLRLDRKVVCGVPETEIPTWLQQRIRGNPVNNLGPYVRPEYRDVTYFMGIDFHQDLIDWPDRPADLITLYVYLHKVTEADAPLQILDGSHCRGAGVFPHPLTLMAPDRWRYGSDPATASEHRQIKLTGPAGFVALWHACTLHGTQPDAADHERISLRYLFARSPTAPAGTVGLDLINDGLTGPLTLPTTRADLDADGRAILKANSVNQSLGLPAAPAASRSPNL